MIEVLNRTKTVIPTLEYAAIFHKVFPKGTMEVSLVFVGDTVMRNLNRVHRHKDKTTNVLAFPLTDTLGEIFINPRQACREAQKFGVSYKERVALLLVHGMLHIKGLDHADERQAEHMERLERKILAEL